MVTHPIYERTAEDHGFVPIDRALGAVRALRHESAFAPHSDTATSAMTRPSSVGQARAERASTAMTRQPSLTV